MNESTRNLLSRFRFGPPVDRKRILEILGDIAQGIPGDYMEFIDCGNGGEGFISDGEYFVAWPVEDVCLSEEVDGLVLIGSNGGLENFGIDLSVLPYEYVMIPCIGPAKEDVRLMGSTFEGFLKTLARVR